MPMLLRGSSAPPPPCCADAAGAQVVAEAAAAPAAAPTKPRRLSLPFSSIVLPSRDLLFAPAPRATATDRSGRGREYTRPDFCRRASYLPAAIIPGAMLLVVDVGNTQTHIGTFRDAELVEHWRFATVRESTADELGAALRNLLELRGIGLADLNASIVSSTVPQLEPEWLSMADRYLGHRMLSVGPG